MKGCKNFEEALILDVLGELDPKRLAPWTAHVAACAACRAERERFARMMHQMKAVATPTPLSPDEVARVNARIRWALNNGGRATQGQQKPPFWKAFGLKPAWAFGIAVCLVLGLSGVHWKGPFRKSPEVGRETTVLTPGGSELSHRAQSGTPPAAAPSVADQKLAAAPSASEAQGDLLEQDREILENLEFLKELDTIRKLVHVVDQDAEAPSPPDASDSAHQPTSLDPRDSSYA